jgi:hypothetical protein
MFVVIMRRNAAERSYDEEGSRQRDDTESKIAHETADALTLSDSGHARTPSGCKSEDIKRTIIKHLFKKLRKKRVAAVAALAAHHAPGQHVCGWREPVGGMVTQRFLCAVTTH